MPHADEKYMITSRRQLLTNWKSLVTMQYKKDRIAKHSYSHIVCNFMHSQKYISKHRVTGNNGWNARSIYNNINSTAPFYTAEWQTTIDVR